jgi:hypothetical protein
MGWLLEVPSAAVFSSALVTLAAAKAIASRFFRSASLCMGGWTASFWFDWCLPEQTGPVHKVFDDIARALDIIQLGCATGITLEGLDKAQD